MRFNQLKFFTVLACLIAFGFVNFPVLAKSNFTTTLESTYLVHPDGQTQVNHHFLITNQTPIYSVTQYALTLPGGQKLKNVHVKSTESLKTNVVEDLKQNSIGLTFNDNLVGEGKSREFEISYLSTDIANLTGQVLEVQIPRLADEAGLTNYQLKVLTPAEFGLPTRTNLNEAQSSLSGNQVVTTLNTPPKKALSLIFGEQQLFDLVWEMNLKNPSDKPGLSQIVLPPDTAYQQLNYTKLEPRPNEIKTDADNNYIATYQLEPNQNLVVKLEAQAKLSLTPQLPAAKIDQVNLVKSQPFWPVNDNQIQTLSAQHQGAEALYDLVVNTLKYDQTKLSQDIILRLGAKAILESPDKAVCQEFTDLFVTLARAQGLPARRLLGFAYSSNPLLKPLGLSDNNLHAWPEFFDPEIDNWRMIDPTWENTTMGYDYFHQFDLNHLVLAINGADSQLPQPLVGSDEQGEVLGTISVKASSKEIKTDPKLKTEIVSYRLLGFNLPLLYRIKLANLTGKTWHELPLELTSNDTNLKLNPAQFTIEKLLPFQTVELPLGLYTTKGWQMAANLVIKYADQSQTLELKTPIINQNWLIGFGVGSLVFLVALIAGSVLVFRFFRSGALRR